VNDSHSHLTEKLDYFFRDPGLLELALTHRSASSSNNERLEYLGDAILGFIIAEALFEKFDHGPEGILTRQRASLVKKETLAGLARDMELGRFLRLGSGERKSGGWQRDSILANAVEAIFGAVYLDSDFNTCRRIIRQLYADLLDSLTLEDNGKDSKTELQEYLQGRKLALPSYRVLVEEGEAHERIFTVQCDVDCLASTVTATGKSKRAAEQSAARKILKCIKSGS